MKKEEFKELFKELIEEFVGMNFIAEGCKECHEVGHSIIPDDFKGSYDKAINELIKQIEGMK